MPHTTTLSRHSDDGEVASYATLNAASPAVARLVELGFDEHDVAIAPRHFGVVDHHPLRQRLRVGLRLGATVGAVSAGLVAILAVAGVDTVVASVLPAVLVGAAAGIAAGITLAIASYWRNRRVTFGGEPVELAPHRFDVTVEHDPAQANHALAGWWDPAAPPARWQQPA